MSCVIAQYPSVTVANTQHNTEETIQINSYSYRHFLSELNFIWKWKNYNQKLKDIKNELQDLKEEYGEATSLIVSLIPIVGEGYDITTLLAGRDPITQEKLDNLGKTLTIVGLASGVGSGAGARKLVEEGLEKLAKELGMSLEEITQVAKEVAKEYKIESLSDIVSLKDKLSLEKFLEFVRVKAKDFKLLKKLKPIKSIDSHIFTKHKFGVNAGGSEFLQGADIEKIIKEGYSKSSKKVAESISSVKGKTIDTIKIEVDMEKQIGVTNNKKNTNILRIIVDYDGNVISSYPIDTFQIK